MTRIDALRALENLRPLVHQDTMAAIFGLIAQSGEPKPDHLLAGHLGSLQFVVSVDGDGQCEVSLSAKHGIPTRAQISAFFRKWDMPEPERDPFRISRGRGIMWVYTRGVRQ